MKNKRFTMLMLSSFFTVYMSAQTVNNCGQPNQAVKLDINGTNLECLSIYQDNIGSPIGIQTSSPDPKVRVQISDLPKNSGQVLQNTELLVIGNTDFSVKLLNQNYTVAEFRNKWYNSSSTGIKIRGSRNKRSYLDAARVDFANWDDGTDAGDGVAREVLLARIVGDMQGSIGNSGCMKFRVNDGVNLELQSALFIGSNGNIGIGNQNVFDNNNGVTAGTLSQFKLHIDGTVGANIIPPDSNLNKVLVWNDLTGQFFYRDDVIGSGNNCSLNTFVPVTDASGSLICSQIQDNGSTVGIGGIVSSWSYGGGTGTQPVKFYVNGNGVIDGYFWQSSDIKYKKKIQSINSAYDIISSINGVSYEYRNSEFPEKSFPRGRTYGVIAQNVEKVLPELVIESEFGFKAVNYDGLIPVLIEAIKEQQELIDELYSILQESTDDVVEYTGIENLNIQYGLDQNIPNPFSNETSIGYSVPVETNSVQLIIFDMNGRTVFTKENLQSGESQIIINGNELEPGMYIYTLIVDGNEFDTKRMILTK